MNEPAQKCEEQIISLFQDKETQVCQGWILKKMGGHLCVYPLYYKYSQGNIPDNIRKCEEISRQSGLEKCGVVGEWNLTTDTEGLCMKEKVQGGLFMKNGNRWAFTGPISTAVIRKIKRRNPPEKRDRKWIYRMKNVSW